MEKNQYGAMRLVDFCSVPATIDYSCFCKVLKRTICIKNIILWYELEQSQIGFHGAALQFDHSRDCSNRKWARAVRQRKGY